VVAGKDQILDPQDGRILSAAWPDARLLELPEASHLSVLRDVGVMEAIAALVAAD
jgi:hypothetical protein